jgi:hypothetical protein
MWIVYDFCAVVFLLIWLFASCVAQWDVPLLLRWDILGLLPNCRFFAPRPVSHDLAVYFRTQSDQGLSLWRPLVTECKGTFAFLWNPEHRLRKSVHDLTEMLQLNEGTRDTRHLSYPYLALLNAATTKLDPDAHASRVQFVITAYAGYEDFVQKIVFLSHFHRC